MEEVTSAQHYFDTLGKRFSAEGAKGMVATFQFNLSGDGGMNFYVNIDDGKMDAAIGTHASPTVTINMTASDYIKMVNGKLNGQMAFMTGKLKISGNIPIAMKMQQVLPQRKA